MQSFENRGLIRRHVRHFTSTLATSAFAWLLASSAPALAEDATRQRARELGYAGVEAYEAGDYAVARENLERAYQTLNAPSLGTWSARALVKLGRLVEAVERYREVSKLDVDAGDTSVQKQAKREAEAELANLLQRVPRLIVRVRGVLPENVSVRVDGLGVPLPELHAGYLVNPGSHQLSARSGTEELRKTVVARESSAATIVFDFQPSSGTQAASRPGQAAQDPPLVAPASESDSSAAFQRTAGWIGLVAGAAGIAVGGVAGVVAIGKLDSIRDNENCRDTTCSREASDLVDSYNGMRTLSSAGFIAGGVLAAAGVTLLLTLPSGDSPSLAITVSPSMVTALHRF